MKKGLLHYLWLLILFSLIALPNVILHYSLGETNRMIGGWLVPVCLFFVGLPFFYKRLKWYIWLLGLILLLVPPCVHACLYYGQQLNASTMLLVVESSKKNQLQFLGQNLFPLLFSYSLLIVVFVFILKKLPNKLLFKQAFFPAVLSVILLFTSFLLRFGNDGNLQWYIKNSVRSFFPFNISKNVPIVLNHIQHRKGYTNRVKDFKFNSYRKENVQQPEIYVFIQGESSRFNHWQINGYERPTSPRLSARTDVLAFPDVVTVCNYTSVSVPVILTAAIPQDMTVATKEKTFLSAYREADFYSQWIGNIQSRGSFSIDIYADELGNTTYTNNDVYEGNPQHDESLVYFLDQAIENASTDKLFFFLHMTGSHVLYTDQYPMKFNHFSPSGKDYSLSWSSEEYKEEIINSYDNTILYSDHVLAEILELLDQKNAVSWMLFVSDHGEYLFDGPGKQTIHAGLDSITLHVPLFLWTSEEYQAQYPEKKKALDQNYRKAISTPDIFHTVLDLGDIHYTGFDKRRSLCNEAYEDKTRVVLTEEGIRSYEEVKDD